MGLNVPFVDIKKSAGTGVPFVDFDANNTKSGNAFDPKVADAFLNKGWSYEDIARDTGFDTNAIRQYADTARPGYGRAQQNTGVSQPTATAYSGGGGGSKPVIDQAAIAALERQQGMANQSLSRIGGQTESALANLYGRYNQERTRLDNSRTDNEADYTTNKQRTATEFGRTKERIGENVRTNVSSLQRLLGSKGSGSSSASQILAPYAAAKAGTSEREEAGAEFSQNNNALDTNWKRYDRDWQNSSRDLDDNKVNQERDTRSQFAQKEADLHNTLATTIQQIAAARGGGKVDTGAIDARINQLLNEIDGYSKRDYSSVISAKDPNYVAPELSKYDIQSRGVEASQQDPTYDETRAFYPVREDEEDKFLQSLYA